MFSCSTNAINKNKGTDQMLWLIDHCFVRSREYLVDNADLTE